MPGQLSFETEKSVQIWKYGMKKPERSSDKMFSDEEFPKKNDQIRPSLEVN